MHSIFSVITEDKSKRQLLSCHHIVIFNWFAIDVQHSVPPPPLFTVFILIPLKLIAHRAIYRTSSSSPPLFESSFPSLPCFFVF